MSRDLRQLDHDIDACIKGAQVNGGGIIHDDGGVTAVVAVLVDDDAAAAAATADEDDDVLTPLGQDAEDVADRNAYYTAVSMPIKGLTIVTLWGRCTPCGPRRAGCRRRRWRCCSS